MSGKPSSKLTKRQNEAVIKHIQTTAIVKRLVKHTLANEDVMTASQINAAKILLAKTMPDLKAIDNKSSDGSMSPPSEIEISIVKAKG